ncbi:MAG: membrane protein insertion efficiency factor YidD [Opitutaceae bacterium]|jgi:putative membrane protein insertion efficiency factor
MPEPLRNIACALARLPAHAALGLIALYQHTLSPALPMLFGPGCGCRFTPTCSHYAAGALRTHGLVGGLSLAARRLMKCHPLHPGGYDPVPASPLDQLGALSLSKRLKLRRSRPLCVQSNCLRVGLVERAGPRRDSALKLGIQ